MYGPLIWCGVYMGYARGSAFKGPYNGTMKLPLLKESRDLVRGLVSKATVPRINY